MRVRFLKENLFYKLFFSSKMQIEMFKVEISNHFYTPVERRDILCYGVVRPSVREFVRGHFSFPDFFLPSLQL
jgi:type II restriction/modification system DNA methylase subunit YeeA